MRTRGFMIVLAIFLGRVAFGYQFQTVPSLAPQLIDTFRLDYAQLGTLIGLFVAPGILLALPLGLLGRRFGEGGVVGTGLVLLTVGPLLSGYAGGAWGIGVGRLVAGAGSVAMIVLQNKIIADWFAGRWFMIAISFSIVGYPVGVSAAQILVPAIVLGHGLFAAFLTDSLIAGASALTFFASYRTGPYASVASRSFRMPSRRECLLVVVAGLAWTAYTSCYAGFVSYVPSLLAGRLDAAVLTAVVMGIVTLGNVPPTLAGGPLAARVGPFTVMLAGSLALVGGSLGIALTPWPVASAIIFGVIGSLHSPLMMAAGTLSTGPENRAVGMGLFYTAYYAGNAIAPALCGHAADLAGGPAGALYAAACIGVLVLPMWLLHAALGRRREDSGTSEDWGRQPARRGVKGGPVSGEA